LFAYYVVDQPHVCFVAEDENNQPLGVLVGYRSSSGRKVHLAAMKVMPPFQGHGIGTGLVTARQAMCQELEVELIWLFCMPDVKGFYEKMGFVEAELGMFKEAVQPGLLVMEWENV
jgi:GNAT superfamily N-acetyltransferase